MIQKGSWKRSPDQEVAPLSQRMMLHKAPVKSQDAIFFLFLQIKQAILNVLISELFTDSGKMFPVYTLF